MTKTTNTEMVLEITGIKDKHSAEVSFDADGTLVLAGTTWGNKSIIEGEIESYNEGFIGVHVVCYHKNYMNYA